MIGIDTNILVRFLTADDLAQYQKALKLFETETVFIADTIFLETEWVLRYAYEYDYSQICEAFHRIIRLENVEMANAYSLQAIDELQVDCCLTVEPSNTDALKLYEKFGFHEKTFITGFYRPNEDRFVLQRRPTRVNAT